MKAEKLLNKALNKALNRANEALEIIKNIDKSEFTQEQNQECLKLHDLMNKIIQEIENDCV